MGTWLKSFFPAIWFTSSSKAVSPSKTTMSSVMIEEIGTAAEIVNQSREDAAADRQMDVGRRFLDKPAEREARNDLRGGRDGDPDQFRTVGR